MAGSKVLVLLLLLHLGKALLGLSIPIGTIAASDRPSRVVYAEYRLRRHTTFIYAIAID